jgi:hypothetical protein
MQFTRLIVNNPEASSLVDSPRLVFHVMPRGDSDEIAPEPNAYTFFTNKIELLDNGWVLVNEYGDLPSQCFPSWRVIVLEGILTPGGRVV